MPTPSRSALLSYWPLLWIPLGLVVSVLRFEADDPFGGIAGCLGGVLLTMLSAVRASTSAAPSPVAAAHVPARAAASASRVRT